MERSDKLIVFEIEGQRFGIDVSAVERVVPAVEVTRLPGLPEHILGMICVKGSDVPVLDMRKILSLPGRAVAARDKMIIAGVPEHGVALVIDGITGFADVSQPNARQECAAPATDEIIVGTLEDDDGMILLCNENLLFSRGQSAAMDAIHARG